MINYMHAANLFVPYCAQTKRYTLQAMLYCLVQWQSYRSILLDLHNLEQRILDMHSIVGELIVSKYVAELINH